tara:strand:- start:1786 stop:1929 length:144 start_codon:yes stop_codon:yes gene_type:complete
MIMKQEYVLCLLLAAAHGARGGIKLKLGGGLGLEDLARNAREVGRVD